MRYLDLERGRALAESAEQCRQDVLTAVRDGVGCWANGLHVQQLSTALQHAEARENMFRAKSSWPALQLTLKTPDVIDRAVESYLRDYVLGVHVSAKSEELVHEWRQELRSVAAPYVRYGEIVVVAFDLVAGGIPSVIMQQ